MMRKRDCWSMRSLFTTIFILGVYGTAIYGQPSQVQKQVASSAMAQEAIKPTSLSDGFIRPATRAFAAIKESTSGIPTGPTPIDDRIKEADVAASTSADKAFVEATKDYEHKKEAFNLLYSIALLSAKVKAETGGDGVPEWTCAPLEDHDVCPSFQAAVKNLLAANRDLAKTKIAIEDCEDSLENGLKTKLFGGAPSCGNKSQSEPK